jgi:two-component system chemotaxis sensor kinase CheA
MTPEQEAVAGLQQAVATPLSRNDLGRLAQMHSWGQILADADAPSPVPAMNASLKVLAASLVTLLERIILDEAADADAGLAIVPEVVAVFLRVQSGDTVDCADLLKGVTAASGAPAPELPAVQADQPTAPTPAPSTAASEPPPPSPQDTVPPPDMPADEPAPAVAPEPYLAEPLVIDMNEREHLEGFLEEAAEHMDAIEAGLLEAESAPSDPDKLNELFRPFHTIKGIAGFLNLRDVNRLTHEIETILDDGRKGELTIATGTIDLILTAVDALKAQLAAIRQYLAAPTGQPCPQPDIVELMARLQRAAAGEQPPDDAARPKLGDVLVAAGDATRSDVDTALAVQAREGDGSRRLGEILVGEGVTSSTQVKTALRSQQESALAGLDSSIRVDTTKLDTLVDAVGELVIAQSMVSLSEKVQEDEQLLRNVSQVSKIVRDVQETAMGMRMVPIGHTFQKMRRLVRDVSRKAGKTVELTISGEETELDKNVIQQISDPLVHLVRNAVDHGIETPAERRAAGKPETGRVSLNAYHQGDSIVIEIADDGRGLDRDKLFAKGVERGLIDAEEQLSEQQVFALILQPGFSTALQVTDISGRGVGMDVVKRNVEQLRGKVELQSEKGRGSTIIVRLPLTLAIIDGMLVQIGDERLIIPTILIEQSLQPGRKQVASVHRRGEMVQVRGELCPLIQLGALFNYGPPIDACENLVVVVQAEGQKLALVVEGLIGQQQVVIKTLGERFKGLKGVSGAAILSDGRVGLILEPSGLLALHKERGGAGYAATARMAPCPPGGRPAPQPAATDEPADETPPDSPTADRESPAAPAACRKEVPASAETSTSF